METYRHVLVALDLSAEAEMVMRRAHDLALRYQAKMSLLHVVEPVVSDLGYDMLPALPVEMESALVDRAREYLAKLARELTDDEVPQYVAIGSVKGEILRLAQTQSADLIVVGTHGRHGVAMMLGSTANAVLHGTPCDVLAVRIVEPGRATSGP